MKNAIIVSLFLALFINSGISQSAESEENPQLSRFLILGQGHAGYIRGLTTINAEYRLFTSRCYDTHVYARAGLGKGDMSELFCAKDDFTASHFGLTILKGIGKHHLEFNAGFLSMSSQKITEKHRIGIFTCTPKVRNNYMATFDVGYRFQMPGESFILNIKIGNFGAAVGIGMAF